MQTSQKNIENGKTNENLDIPNLVPLPDPDMQINQGIAQGFGDFFLNPHDPLSTKQNVPIKQDGNLHIAYIVATLFLGAGLGVGVTLLGDQNYIALGTIVVVLGYLIYLGVSFCCNQIGGYILNMKKFDNYAETYDKMVQGRGYFHFWIECYHYRTVKTKKGTRREKVVTHTAQEDYFPLESADESGNVTNIRDLRKYVFVNYLKRFYFVNRESQQKCQRSYQSFIHRNKRDTYQNHTRTFQIENFEPEVGFCRFGENESSTIMYYGFTLLGLALPYAYILERYVSRYDINILKRLTC